MISIYLLIGLSMNSFSSSSDSQSSRTCFGGSECGLECADNAWLFNSDEKILQHSNCGYSGFVKTVNTWTTVNKCFVHLHMTLVSSNELHRKNT